MHGAHILYMATVVATPFAATLCGDMGAKVTKLELPHGSDTLRHMLPIIGEHALFWKVTDRGIRDISVAMLYICNGHQFAHAQCQQSGISNVLPELTIGAVGSA